MPTSEYRTRNLYEAAYLSIVSSMPELEKDKDNIYWFLFPPECEEISKDYWNGTAETTAKGFADAVRTLKERMTAQK